MIKKNVIGPNPQSPNFFPFKNTNPSKRNELKNNYITNNNNNYYNSEKEDLKRKNMI